MADREEEDLTKVVADIARNLVATHFGDELAADGITTVALDAKGRLVEHRPDGTTALLPEVEDSNGTDTHDS